jgi:hypothetical protein
LGGRLQREQKTVEAIIRLYCKNKHKTKSVTCEKCSSLINYALKRVELCKFGANKPICGRCKVHCYKPDMREEIKIVMRSAGVNLALRHPVMTIFHFIDVLRFKALKEFN